MGAATYVAPVLKQRIWYSSPSPSSIYLDLWDEYVYQHAPAGWGAAFSADAWMWTVQWVLSLRTLTGGRWIYTLNFPAFSNDLWMNACMYNFCSLLFLSLWLIFACLNAIHRLASSTCNWMDLKIRPRVCGCTRWPQGAAASGSILSRAPQDSAD